MAETSQPQRLFIAIPCSPPDGFGELQDRLHQWSHDKASKVRPVANENLHITLVFLGMLEAIERELVKQVMDHVLHETRNFSLQIQGLGYFANAIWLGIKPARELQLLEKRLNEELLRIGLPGASKRYLPHVTVARIGTGGRVNLSELSNEYSEKVWGTLPVNAVNLYQSRTLPSGAEYTISYQCKLLTMTS